MAKFITNVLLFSIILILFGILISIVSLRNNVKRFVDHAISSDYKEEVSGLPDQRSERYDYDYYVPEEYNSYNDNTYDYYYYYTPDPSWDEVYPGYVVEKKPDIVSL